MNTNNNNHLNIFGQMDLIQFVNLCHKDNFELIVVDETS